MQSKILGTNLLGHVWSALRFPAELAKYQGEVAKFPGAVLGPESRFQVFAAALASPCYYTHQGKEAYFPQSVKVDEFLRTRQKIVPPAPGYEIHRMWMGEVEDEPEVLDYSSTEEVLSESEEEQDFEQKQSPEITPPQRGGKAAVSESRVRPTSRSAIPPVKFKGVGGKVHVPPPKGKSVPKKSGSGKKGGKKPSKFAEVSTTPSTSGAIKRKRPTSKVAASELGEQSSIQFRRDMVRGGARKGAGRTMLLHTSPLRGVDTYHGITSPGGRIHHEKPPYYHPPVTCNDFVVERL